MPVLGDRAVVLGASMGGLLAARVLADFYRTVVVIERDELPVTIDAEPSLTHELVPFEREVADRSVELQALRWRVEECLVLDKAFRHAVVAGHRDLHATRTDTRDRVASPLIAPRD